jgi:peptidyl-prolyl cis-trans isomerase SurA
MVQVENGAEIDRRLRSMSRMDSGCIRAGAAFVLGALLMAGAAVAQTQGNVPADPYGGATVENIIARVNDRIISASDYQRSLDELNQEATQHGDTMQQAAEARRDLLRTLIDQQLWLSKGKQLGITGDTELIQRLDEIRKQYHLTSMDDLEKAAQEQGVSFEDFKANIRNGIITQTVMRQQVGEHVQITPGEAMRYYEEHKQDYAQPESVHLGEILISTGDGEDPAKLAEAKAKADDIEARLHAGGDFAQLARSFSNGPTAASGGELGQFRRGTLGKELEDSTFVLQAGQWTEPILTRQGYIILKVTQHTTGGIQPFSDVQMQVEDALYMNRMEPAIRAYLTKMREEAFIDIAPGYTDTGASANESKPTFSAYAPPSPKKKKKIERTRYRVATHSFRQKSAQSAPAASPAPEEAAAPVTTKKTKGKGKQETTQAAGNREKIRFGQAPRETLPTAATEAGTENAGALPETASNASAPDIPEESAQPERKTRFSERAKEVKTHKSKAVAQPAESLIPPPPTAAEAADQQAQSSPLGLGSTAAADKKKVATGEKTRLSDEKRKPAAPAPQPQMTPAPTVTGAPAPAPEPQQ